MQKKPVNRVCFIPGCTSEYGQVLFMSAYKSDGLQQWWSESGWSRNRKNKTIPKNTRVCERHFEERFIDRSYKMPRLFPDAWPTMNVVEPKPEDLEGGGGRGRGRVDGRGRPPGRTETNPKYYCRLCGKREKRPLEDLMCDLKDGEDLLKFLLGQYYGRVDLPQGVCDDCMDTAESCVEFVRKCEETQLKLERIFVENEALKLEPDCELLENTAVVQLKQEKVEVIEEMEAEYLEQSQESPRDVKPVELITNDDPPPEDYGEDPPDGFDDGGGDSDSDQSVEDSKSAAEEEETRPRRRRKSRVSDTSDEDSFVESDEESDSEDDKPLRKRQVVVPKKRGRKPKQKLLEDYENETKPKVGRGRKKSTSATSQETSRICPICGKILIHKGNFTSHLKIHSEKKDYVCNICGKQYYIRRELQMHIESLHEKKTFVCNICGIKCAWRKGLQRHMKNKHSDESSLKHKCTYCGKAFLLPNQLRLHVMKHTGDRITCEICGAGYRFNYMLTQHKMREHGMEFKGVKLYKNSNRSRKSAKQQQPAESAEPSQPPPPPPSTTPATVEVIVPHMLEPSHDSMMSSESSQSHPIQQQQQHHHPQQYHPGHYPAGFVYPPGGHAATAPAAMMLPPGSYSG
uniref:Zinc finger protein 350 n=2 Tax=Culex pipiens TaxID=7175 RepID=A0A8D8H3W9_CULPI